MWFPQNTNADPRCSTQVQGSSKWLASLLFKWNWNHGLVLNANFNRNINQCQCQDGEDGWVAGKSCLRNSCGNWGCPDTCCQILEGLFPTEEEWAYSWQLQRSDLDRWKLSTQRKEGHRDFLSVCQWKGSSSATKRRVFCY